MKHNIGYWHWLPLKCFGYSLLYYDMCTEHLASNPIMHVRMKHVELEFHFLRYLVLEGRLEVRYTPSVAQLSDILTKPLPDYIFTSLKTKLMVLPPLSV